MIDQEMLIVGMLVLARVGAFIAFFPLFSKKQLPNLVKAGLAMALTIFWVGHVQAMSDSLGAPSSMNLVTLALLAVKESSIGAALAVAMGLMFWPARVAGAYVGQELGLSLASISDPGSQDSSTLVTRIFETFAVLIFFTGNLHHFMILAIHHSFSGLSATLDLQAIPYEGIANMFNHVSDHGMVIAGPLMILFMMITLVLAFLNRAAPALNLFTVGMSIRSGLGILCLLLLSPIVFPAIYDHMIQVQHDLEDLVGQMSQ